MAKGSVLPWDTAALGAFREALLSWYARNRRDLPWRRTKDPYAILVAEVLLQQTRVAQALGYYARFLAAFPDFAALAAAPEEKVLGIWAGAGYYRRARQLHRLAQRVVREGLPRTYAGLLGLPGVGPYTAAAVASQAFGEPVAVVDGNVRRVLARLCAERAPRPRWLRETAQALLDPRDPGTWNQALMELGALVCRPRNPGCGGCPGAFLCRGRGEPHRYPRPRRRRPKTEEVVALVLVGPEGVHLERREGGPLAGLWGVPLAPGPDGLARLLARFGLAEARWVGTVRHAFSHRRWVVRVYAAAWPGAGGGARPVSALDRKILSLVGSQLLTN
ncbi:MAG: A/G-specific adenine glycosylase [Candidatus Bipolaricaulota bacterium]|nr:A/G-specific adenine glycosylase [Candidatus Bipolaricaulota bacterium]MDW8152558.1 A/G-specific adenine glycosylase [Candidatus Bipolaricaulota bacterium]